MHHLHRRLKDHWSDLRNDPPRQIAVFVSSVGELTVKTTDRDECLAPVGDVARQETATIMIFDRMFVQGVIRGRRRIARDPRDVRFGSKARHGRTRPAVVHDHIVIGKKNDVAAGLTHPRSPRECRTSACAAQQAHLGKIVLTIRR